MAKTSSKLKEIIKGPSRSTRIADQREAKIEVASIAVKNTKPSSKQEFLDSIGLGDRPNSHRAIAAWEEYQSQN